MTINKHPPTCGPMRGPESVAPVPFPATRVGRCDNQPVSENLTSGDHPKFTGQRPEKVRHDEQHD